MIPAGWISIEQLAAAINRVRSMSLLEKAALTDEIFQEQPNLLASCLVQQRLGVSDRTIEFLLGILLVCFQAMKESGRTWPLITEDEQERQLTRYIGMLGFSEDIADPAMTNAVRTQYTTNHPEAPLLTFVLSEFKNWLKELSNRGADAESDKFVMIAGVNLVNCIAYVKGNKARLN